MSDSTLKENVSSETIAGYNALSPKNAPKRIFVYVESYEDVSFWRNVWHEYESLSLMFDILPPTKKGKSTAIEKRKEVMQLQNQSGPFLIVCVDSDYDYLLPEHSDQSKLVNSDPFIFQTYSYSIENLLCFSDSLHNVCVQSTKNDRKLIDFNALLKTFSNIVYRLLLWNLYFRRENDHTTFTVSDFCDLIKLTGRIDIDEQLVSALAAIKKRADVKIHELENTHKDAIADIENLSQELTAQGLNNDNAYLFVHGHTIKDNVVLMVLKQMESLLKKEKTEQIQRDYLDKQEAENNRNHYKNQTIKIELVLDTNTAYQHCFLYQKIKADAGNYIKTHHAQ